MRRVLVGDLLTAARYVACFKPSEWPSAARGLIFRAHAAHAYFKRFHRPHISWGDGSLLTAALSGDADAAAWSGSGADFLALEVVAHELALFKRLRP